MSELAELTHRLRQHFSLDCGASLVDRFCLAVYAIVRIVFAFSAPVQPDDKRSFALYGLRYKMIGTLTAPAHTRIFHAGSARLA